MSSGFSIGLNALQANSAAIEVASKNIAASNVSGFKSTEYLFQEALTRSLQPSSSGRFGTIGTSGVSRRNYASGSSKYSASPLDMSITGDGFFTLGLFKEPSAEKTYFTRSGQFLTDKDGFIVSSSGLYLYGYQPTTDGTNINPNVVGPLKEPSSPMEPNRTEKALVSVNLDSRLTIVQDKVLVGATTRLNSISVEDPATYSHVQQFPLYDKLGQQHSVSLYFRRVDKRVYDVYVNVDGQTFATGDASSGTALTIQMPDSLTRPQSARDPKPVASFGFFEGKLVQVGNSKSTFGPSGEVRIDDGKVTIEGLYNEPDDPDVDPPVAIRPRPGDGEPDSLYAAQFKILEDRLKTSESNPIPKKYFIVGEGIPFGSTVTKMEQDGTLVFQSEDNPDTTIDEKSNPPTIPPGTYVRFYDQLPIREIELSERTTGQVPGNLKLKFNILPPAAGKSPLNPSLVFSDPIEFELDFSDTTSFASTFEVKKVEQDGFAAGSLTGLSTDDKGQVRGQFSNGKTVLAGQLQLATFKGLGGLREVSNNTFQVTPQSGDAIFGRPTEQSLGSIRSNSVEEANTDMAGELVRLMVQQRNYQANAQSIRTQVEILSVTIDVTR